MKNTNFKKFTTTFLTVCAVIFGLTTLTNAAVKPELINKAPNGDNGNDSSQSVSVSGDGRYVVFQSRATNLVSGITDTNDAFDIFLRDTQTGTTRCLSCTPAANSTSTANGFSVNPIITPDGRYVVFASIATDLVGGADINNALDVFRFDTQTNERVLVSSAVQSPIVTANGASGNNNLGRSYDISDDGRYIAFSSLASDLTGVSDTNTKSDVFVRDMQDGATNFVSRSLAGNAATGDSYDPSISANGQYIAFSSLASDLVSANDANSGSDIFVYDFNAQQIRVVSVSTRFIGNTGDQPSVAASISKDGSRIAYFTFAKDITNIQIPDGDIRRWNVVVYDVGFRQNSLVSVNVAGNASGNDDSGTGIQDSLKNVSISANGRYVAFESRAGNLSPLVTTTGVLNAFRRDLTRGLTEVVSITSTGASTSRTSTVGLKNSAMSSDGRFVAFTNSGDTLADFPGNGFPQVYVRDMANGVTSALTLNNAGNALSSVGGNLPRISANGKAVVFLSVATDLTPTPTVGFSNAFLARVPTPQKAVSDFDGDGKTDYAVWRPSNGAWFVLPNTGNYIASSVVLGTNGDKPVPADYSGDGKTDYAVFRPSNGTWYITDTASFGSQAILFGQSGDQPVPADYDGDGKADIAVYRPSNGTWYILNSSNGAVQYITFGLSDDKTVPADYDGDGKADVAVYRSGVWYVRQSSNNQVSAYNYGAANDQLVPADYDGDGKTDYAVFRSGVFYILETRTGNSRAVNWGFASDLPAVGDFDGDGKADVTIFRPETGDWWILSSATGKDSAFHWGQNGDAPAPSAFVR